MVGPDLISERLGDELLVYDLASDEAHRLEGAAAAQFRAAADDLSRREVLRRFTLAGAATMSAGSLLTSIVAPAPAQAQSGLCVGGCGKGEQCCTTGSAPHCEPGNATCCGNGACTGSNQCCPNGACCPSLAACCTNPPCCPNTEVCVNGTCQQPMPGSDIGLKREFASVEPGIVIALFT
jgi:hypothetical protein